MARPEIISGRRDFDVVTFADYRNDQAEITELAAAALSRLRKERDAFRTLLWAAVSTAGGTLLVNRPMLETTLEDVIFPLEHRDEYEVSLRIDTDQLEFRIRSHKGETR